MSIDRSKSHHIGKISPIIDVLKGGGYRVIILVSGVIYALVYMFVVGIISYYPGIATLNVTTPIATANSLGVMIIPGKFIFIFAFYSAIAFLIVSSFLVGLNIALMTYSNNLINTRGYCKSSNSSSKGIFGIIPAFFTSFSCCGGGLLVFIIGPTAFSSLALYSNYVAIITVAGLTAATVVMSRKISQSKKTITDYYCFVEGERRV